MRKFSEEHRKKLSENKIGENNPRGMLGKHHTDKTRKIMSVLKKGEKNWMYGKYGRECVNWKEDEAEYAAIHARVRKRKPKPENCDICGLPEFYENLGKLELSDMTGLCLDDDDNFQYAHHSCHVNYDKENNIIHVKLLKYFGKFKI